MKNEMKKLSRRTVLAGLAAAGAGAAIVGTATTAKAAASTDTNLQAQKQRLDLVLQNVEMANDRIKGTAVRWIPPVEPDMPCGTPPADPDQPAGQPPVEPDRCVFEALLNKINSECQGVMDTANALLLRRGA